MQAEANGEESGLLRMLRHDFGRNAVRNMVNRGVPERVAMKITGHKTRAVLDRYHIVSPGDLQEAARKTHGHVFGHVTGDRPRAISEPLEKELVAAGGLEPPT